MATSGSIDFSVSRDDIIKQALQLTGVLYQGQSPSADDIADCSIFLNGLVKTLQVNSIHLFAIDRIYVFPEKNKSTYSIGTSTSDKVAASIVETNLSTEAVSGSSTITVDSIDGISDGDNIGISTGTELFWTTVNGAPSGNTVSLTDATTDSASASANVYVYSETAARPVRVLEAYRYDGSNEIEVEVIPRRTYDRLTNKDSDGQVNQVYYDPQIGTGYLSVWPQASNEDGYIRLVVERALQDFDSSANTPDFPSEWYLPLAYNLAVIISPSYGTPTRKQRQLSNIAASMLDMVESNDVELETSIRFEPDDRYMR